MEKFQYDDHLIVGRGECTKCWRLRDLHIRAPSPAPSLSAMGSIRTCGTTCSFLASYSVNDNNNLTLFGATNLGATGLGARFYGNATRPYSSSTVAAGWCREFRQFIRNRRVLQLYDWQPHAGAGGAVCLVNEKSRGRTNGLFQPFRCRLVRELSARRVTVLSRRLARIFHQQRTGDLVSQSWRSGLRHGGRARPGVRPGRKSTCSCAAKWGLLHLTTVGAPGSVGYGSSGTGRNQATFLAEVGVLF